jgi:DNA-binding SARP family transcriptional activator
MNGIQVHLFGRFRVQREQQTPIAIEAGKIQELFTYLLLFPDRPHPREVLADLLWNGTPAAQSRSYLRKALWQLETAMDVSGESSTCRILLAEPGWVQLNPQVQVWRDVAVFEQTFALVQGLPGRLLHSEHVLALQGAVDLYRGDLLEGCYQDWCITERERLQHLYLAMLDKLMDHCEAHHQYEVGLGYGARILRHDRARERTHRRLMRLHYLNRDRTAALRQYAQCRAALLEELGVEPARQTVLLYERIKADQPGQLLPTQPELLLADQTPTAVLLEMLDRLRQLSKEFSDMHHRVQDEIEAIELAFRKSR